MPSKTLNGKFYVERGSPQVMEVSHSQLCDPHFVFTSGGTGEKGRMFPAFYLGLQKFAKKNLQRIDELGVGLNSEENDRAYHALQAIVGTS